MLIKSLHNILFSIAVILSLAYSDYAKSDTAPPQYEQNCVACHARMTGGNDNLLYQRKDRLVQNFNELKARIDYCQQSLQLKWSETQHSDVSNYLNQSFYHFPK